MILSSCRLAGSLALQGNARPLTQRLHASVRNSIGQTLGIFGFYRKLTTSNPLIWFHLYDYGTGMPYKGTSATFVLRSALAVPIIAAFADAVKVKCHNKLSTIDANDLKVFKNKDSFDKRDSKEEKVNLQFSYN
jgi:hypothetical protein